MFNTENEYNAGKECSAQVTTPGGDSLQAHLSVGIFTARTKLQSFEYLHEFLTKKQILKSTKSCPQKRLFDAKKFPK